MSRDKRKKGCPNEQCINHIKQKKFSMDTTNCPECNTELILVCRKCYCEIEDRGKKHRVCSRCEVKKHENKQNMKKRAKGVAELGIGSLLASFAVGVKNEAGKQATKYGGKAVGVVIKGVGRVIKR